MQMFDMIQVARVFVAANQASVFESLPGAGKTSVLNAMYEAAGGFLDTISVVTRDATDFGGIPFAADDALVYDLRPERRWVRLNEEAATGRLVGIHLDEFNLATRGTAGAALKVVDEGIVGDVKLDPRIRKHLSINPAEANGGVDLTPAMANRLGHIPFHFPLDEWADLLENDFPVSATDPWTIPDEDDIVVASLKYRQYVARYARKHRDQIDTYPEDPADRSKAFGTRRTWHRSTRVMGTSDLLGYSDDVRDQALTAMIGANLAGNFADWMDAQNVIDVTEAFTKPDTFQLPMNDDDKLLMTLDRIAEEAISRGDVASIEAACEICVRLHGEGRPGMAGAAMQSITAYVYKHKDKATLLTTAVRSSMQVYKPQIEQMKAMSN